MKVGFGCDHTAVELKTILMEHLQKRGFECIDYGTTDPNVRVNYPDFGLKVAEAIKSNEIEKGVLVCGTGVGISLAANKVPGIRAAVCSEPYTAKLTVEHNDANIIAMGARVVGSELAKMIVDSFFDAKFEGGRHAERVRMISDIEKKILQITPARDLSKWNTVLPSKYESIANAGTYKIVPSKFTDDAVLAGVLLSVKYLHYI